MNWLVLTKNWRKETEITDLKASLNNKNTEITKLKLEKQNLHKKLWYENKKLEDNRQSLVDEIDKERLEIEVKKNELEIKEKEFDYLQSKLEGETIQTFHEGKYNDEICLCIIELLSMNVSINKVNEVIQTVVKSLTNKKIDKLPSKGFRCQLLIEARHLADIQVGHAMLEGIDLNTVLGNTPHGDGTTKYHHHFQNYQVTTADGKTLSTGLMETQDAETILQCWKERVKELAKAVAGTNGNEEFVSEKADQLLLSVKNTMSDQCATNGIFNKLLLDLRSDLVPKIINNWDGLTQEEQSKLMSMGNFFCKVHPLLSFAEEANKALLKFENAVLQGKSKYAFPTSGESGIFRLIRTSCGAFQKRGNQQAGMSEDFNSYLSEIGSFLHLIPLKGNRFNVAFYNGAAVYFHTHHITEFIDNQHKPNRLLLAVSEDMQNKIYLAGIRALGIISRLITGPYFRIVGETDHILEMNLHLMQLQLSLRHFSKDASPLLDGEPAFSEETVKINKDEVYNNLLEVNDDEFQVLAQQILEILCLVILIVLKNNARTSFQVGNTLVHLRSCHYKLQVVRCQT